MKPVHKKSTDSSNSKKKTIETLLDFIDIKHAENLKTNMIQKIFTKNRKLSYDKIKMRQSNVDILKVCYTGGPCAGKTTSITRVADQLREKGFTVFIVPEAASMIFSAGGNLDMSKYNDLQAAQFQYFLMMLQTTMEDIFTSIAMINDAKNIVILCDRGIMDGKAYMTDPQWSLMQQEFNINPDKMRDERYNIVIHMVTAASGKPEKYDFENNKARWENPQFAVELDQKLQEAWRGHENYQIIGNELCLDFQEKLDSASRFIFKELGIPVALTFYKKFVIENPKDTLPNLLQSHLGVSIYSFKLTDVIFFHNEWELTYYRKREQKNGLATFIKCEKSLYEGKYNERRRQISYREYLSMKQLKSKIKTIFRKIRYTFMYQNVNYTLDSMELDPGVTTSVLIVQGFEKIQQFDKINMPAILKSKIVEEVPRKNVYFFGEMISKDFERREKIRSPISHKN